MFFNLLFFIPWNLYEAVTHVIARGTKIYVTFTRLRDDFEFQDNVPSHNPLSTVDCLPSIACVLAHPRNIHDNLIVLYKVTLSMQIM